MAFGRPVVVASLAQAERHAMKAMKACECGKSCERLAASGLATNSVARDVRFSFYALEA